MWIGLRRTAWNLGKRLVAARQSAEAHMISKPRWEPQKCDLHFCRFATSQSDYLAVR
jgi:hypothetical protein